jgi:hypothetical protein
MKRESNPRSSHQHDASSYDTGHKLELAARRAVEFRIGSHMTDAEWDCARGSLIELAMLLRNWRQTAQLHIVGDQKPRAFFQRVPVPVGMWRPFGAGPSVPLHVGRPGTIEVAGQRVAFLICYEQLLVLPVLLSAVDRPTLIVGMANQYWVRETSIPAAQRASLTAWSRLFALPLLIAENK